MQCRFCNHPLTHTFCDLGKTPLSNSYLTKEALDFVEEVFPLHAYICSHCLLVQLPQYCTPDAIFSEYAYFSSFSTTWLKHCEEYVEKMALLLSPHSQVVELASNDGYLLQYFQKKGIPVLGIEPAKNVADKAIEKGIPTLKQFFGKECAKNLDLTADLIIANNVLAHVPDLNDFVAGMKLLLKPNGRITLEFPHLLQLMAQNQFDTIYHEHFSYFSLCTLFHVFAHHELEVFDAEELPTHGGSLRLYLQHPKVRKIEKRVEVLLNKEREQGLDCLESYTAFRKRVSSVKKAFLDFLTKHEGEVVAYGAPAKGNTFLNTCGVTNKQIPFTVDLNPYKQGRFLPGSHIPIEAPEKISLAKPKYLLLLPWNLKEEIMQQMAHIRSWGGKFVIPIPQLEIL
ncbi:MAG: methyltransferase domain-containing protein [Chlamydiales bacterium]